MPSLETSFAQHFKDTSRKIKSFKSKSQVNLNPVKAVPAAVSKPQKFVESKRELKVYFKLMNKELISEINRTLHVTTYED